jgi:YD repeat-containing protein
MLTASGPVKTVGYGCNNADQVNSLTYPGNRTVSYGFTTNGQVSTLTDWASRVTAFGYDNTGAPKTTSYPNGVLQTNSYDPAEQLTSITDVKGATTLASFGYTYDNAGKILTDNATITGLSADNRTYGYSAADQLTECGHLTWTRWDGLSSRILAPAGW